MQVTDYCLDNYLKVIKKSQKTEEESNDMEGSKLTKFVGYPVRFDYEL